MPASPAWLACHGRQAESGGYNLAVVNHIVGEARQSQGIPTMARRGRFRRIMPDPSQFFGLPSPDAERADALVLPLPIEKTVSYGTGAASGPQAIVAATLQVETFDEETLVDFAESPRLHVLPPVANDGSIEDCLSRIQDRVRSLRGKFLLSLGGEHSVTYGVVNGLVDPSDVTVVQIDAHGDLADTLTGRHWSHGTVMRRLLEKGCRLMQIGIRSMTRDEYNVATTDDRVVTYFAHQLGSQWFDMLDALRRIEGQVYLTIDVDGLDPSIIPSTGTPQPGGLSWRQTMEILRVLTNESHCRLIGADIVEFVASPVPPGCDPVAARLATKLLAWWWRGQTSR
jgi:agmatinase